MPTSLILSQILNGFAIGMLYAVLAFGLSVIKGLMNLPNVAHGVFFAFGAYVFASVAQASGSYWLGLISAGVVVGVIGAVLEYLTVRRIYSAPYVFHLLLLFGLSLILGEAIILIWGPVGQSYSPPEFLSGALILGKVVYPKYLLFVTLVAGLGISAVWLLIERTKLGAMIRAGIERREMVGALGVNISLLFTLCFGLGAGLAGVSGGLAAPVVGLSPAMGHEMLALAFVVVVIGGLGSLYGAIFAGVLVGIVQSIVALFKPELSFITIYVAMIGVLLFRPQGLLGER